ncbi:MAG: YneF family protein [Acholeplasmatales bacterium]|nr:YneF family protein [Acholeplasmatales bacterium]
MPVVSLEIWQFIIIVVIAILVAAVVTFFVTRKIFQNQLKKNPPINEATIRAMMTQMGRTPSEKQVRAVMRSMDEANGTSLSDKKSKKK